MSGIRRQIVGELSRESTKSKGKAYTNKMAKALSPESISKEKPKTQPDCDK